MLSSCGRFVGWVVFLFLILSLSTEATVLSATIRVDWSPPTAPDLDRYKVYFRCKGYDDFQTVTIDDADATSCMIKQLVAGTTYEFALRACDTSGNWSGFSNIATCEALPWDGEQMIVTGPGPGPDNPPRVRLFDPSSGLAEPLLDFPAYGVNKYGVNVAVGDLDGHGYYEIITGAGPGAIFGPHVRGWYVDGDGDTHSPMPGVSFMAYRTNKYGVNVAVGDIDRDGYDEIITGAGPGAVFGPHVRGWNVDGAMAAALPEISFFSYGTQKWGVNVAVGDIDGDDYDEIITGAGPGAVFGPHVRAWNFDGGTKVTPIPGVSFFAYGTPRWGVNVTCGDIDGDGIDEIITGPGPGAIFSSHVRGWNHDGSGAVTPIPGVSFYAYDGLFYGVNVACGDIDRDGVDEIVTAPGPGQGEGYTARIRGWNYSDGVLQQSGLDFLAYNEKIKFGARLAVGHQSQSGGLPAAPVAGR